MSSRFFPILIVKGRLWRFVRFLSSQVYSFLIAFFIPCEARLAVQRTNVYHTGGKRTRLLFLIPDPTEPPRYAMMAVDISTDSLFALLLPPAASEKKTRKRDDYEKLSKSTEKGDLIKFEVISTGMKKQKKNTKNCWLIKMRFKIVIPVIKNTFFRCI